MARRQTAHDVRTARLDQSLRAMFEALKAGTPPALLDTLHQLQLGDGSRRHA